MDIWLAINIEAKTEFNKVKTELEKVENIFSSLMSIGGNHP
jgi:hypothetical protein